MPLFNTGAWTATKQVLIGGTTFNRGDDVPVATLMGERKRDVLINRRFVVPEHDLHLRKTDNYGFGAAPRKHPTPAYHSARFLRDMGVWPIGPRMFALLPLVVKAMAPTPSPAPKKAAKKKADPVVEQVADPVIEEQA